VPLRPDRPLRVFLSSAPADQEPKERLWRHLQHQIRRGAVDLVSSSDVGPGEDWRAAIAVAMTQADVAVVLLSADYLASDHIMDAELPALLDRRDAGSVEVIPVLLRPCVWEDVPRLGALFTPPGGDALVPSSEREQDAFWTALAKHLTGARTEAPGEAERGEAEPGDVASRLTLGMAPVPAGRFAKLIRAYTATPELPYCGRVDDVEALRAWIDGAGTPPSLLLLAPAGRGKSALLVRVAAELVKRPDVGVAFIPISQRFGTNLPDVFLLGLAGRLHALHARPPPDLKRASEGELLDLVLLDLQRSLPEERRLVVILDGLDRLGWIRRDVEIRTLPPLEEADVAAVLAALPPPQYEWARRPGVAADVRRLCEGEPLTLWLMLVEGGLRSLRSPAELASWRPGLSAAFRRWGEAQRERWGGSDPLGEHRGRDLLSLLAVAESPLTAGDLGALSPALADGLPETVRRLSPVVCGTGTTTGYVLAHPGFAYHLREERDLRWANDLDAARKSLRRYVEQAAEQLAADPLGAPHVPRYALFHRAAYLQADGAPLSSWMQVTARGWYEAWLFHEPGGGPFLHDVDRAWDAVRKASPAPGENLGEEVRCALARGSAGSLVAVVDSRLLELLLEHEVWTPARALAYVRAAPVRDLQGEGRSELIAVLSRRAPPDLLPALFGIACELLEIPRYEAVQGLLPIMAEKAPDEAAARIRALPDPRSGRPTCWRWRRRWANRGAPRSPRRLARSYGTSSPRTSGRTSSRAWPRSSPSPIAPRRCARRSRWPGPSPSARIRHVATCSCISARACRRRPRRRCASWTGSTRGSATGSSTRSRAISSRGLGHWPSRVSGPGHGPPPIPTSRRAACSSSWSKCPRRGARIFPRRSMPSPGSRIR
jgi:TIR domain